MIGSRFPTSAVGQGCADPLLRPYASRLIGVDLSGGMLALAGEKNVDSELERCG